MKAPGKHRAQSMPSYGSRTDIGLVREHNEDSLLVREPLFIVADGMGGHAAGEVASEIAVQTIADLSPDHADADDFARAIIAANKAIIQAAREGKGRRGMGTTITAAILDGNHLLIAQVGDSRAYLLHDNKLQRLTRDHSLVADLVESGEITEEEARFHPNRSVITRALGTDSSTLPDMYEVNVAPGDRLLLCSDGLTSMIHDDAIEHILRRAPEPQTCADRLANAALSEGGIDNITTIVVDIPSNDEKHERKTILKSRISAIFASIALLAVLIGSAVGAHMYLNHVAFITTHEGEVVICTGLPGSVFGISTWKVAEDTGIHATS
ncbi:MAG: Stp1/IreP family PP2C-type Ser/Thr phosphatase, partial [Eggerthellaceae bacterium]|nr:Stp1/IreP family PP2C-type Ser/Thr phosphatase [Eggerthellaceae bacterium]